MNRVNRFLTAVAVGLFLVGTAAADTLELKDGRVLKGKYLGGTQAVLRFEINGEVQAFSTTDIVALTFTGRAGYPAGAPESAPPPAPAARLAGPGYDGARTLPAGQTPPVRAAGPLDPSKKPAGDVLHPPLETQLPRRQFVG